MTKEPITTITAIWIYDYTMIICLQHTPFKDSGDPMFLYVSSHK